MPFIRLLSGWERNPNLDVVMREHYCRFLLHIHGLAPDTKKLYKRAVKAFLAYAPPDIKCRDVTAEQIERFLIHLRKTHKASSVNTYLMAIRSFYRWLEECQDCPNIACKIHPERPLPPHQRILSQDEYQKLLESTNGFTRDALIVLANTGLRASEFLSIRPENISGEFLTIIGKRKKQRSIPLNKSAKSILNKPYFFNLLKSKTRYNLNYLCIIAAQKAGIPKFSPHSLRHYFCTQLISAGIPRTKVAKMMGDTAATIDTVYTHIFNTDLLGATNVLE